MRITNDYGQTSFGTVIATESAVKYLNRNLSKKKIEKVNEIISDQKGKKPDINLHTGTFVRAGSNRPMEYLRATVGEEIFKEGLFTSAYGVVKDAAEYVNSLISGKSIK